MTYQDQFYQVYYISAGTTYNLNGSHTFTTVYGNSLTIAFSYLGDQGFGLAPLHRITTRGPLQHGDSDIDFRLDPRVLQIPLVVKNESTSAPRAVHYMIRSELLKIFNPRTSATLQIRPALSGSGFTKQFRPRIDVQVLGGLSFDVDPIDYHIRTVVQLRADDPTWYEYDGSGSPFVIAYPSGSINGTQLIPSGGNWPAFPVIRVNGPITNPTITNNTTGQSISLTATISAGAYYDIDLSYGKKTVVDDLGANRISTVSATSNLATWSLLPGSNTIAITGTANTAATNATFTFTYRYTGI